MKKLFNDEFKNNSLLMLVFTIVASVCNYAFQLVMGAILSKEDYGTVNALLSLSVVFGVPSGWFLVVSSKYTAHFAALGERENAAALVKKLERLSALLAVAALALGALFSPVIAGYLKIEDTRLVIAALAVTALGFAVNPLIGALQGSKRFLEYGITSVLTAALRLVVSMLLAYVGVRVFGVLASLFVAYGCVFVFCLICLRELLKTPCPHDFKLPQDSNYYIGVLLIQLCSVLMSNGDVLLVKAYAAIPADAGVYSSGIVFGKISLYIVGAVTSVMFPMVSEASAKAQNSSKLLFKALLYGGGASVLFALFLNLIGKYLFAFLFAGKYLDAVPLLPAISLFVVPVSLVTIELQYFMAKGNTAVLCYSLIGGYALIFALVSRFHSSVSVMLYIMGGVLTAVFVINLIYAITSGTNKRVLQS